MDETPLQYLFGLLRSRFLLLFIVSTLAAALTGAYAYGFRADEYTAEAVLYVLESYWDSYNNMRYDTNASTQFAADYKALIGKGVLMDRYARALDVPDLNSVRIDIEAENGTRVLKLSVTGKDPAFCARVANTVGMMFVAYIRELTQMDGLSLALEAGTPGTPSGPPRKLYVALAFVGAFFLGVCALLVRELVDTKLQSDEDI
ncbi:MAG TPA: hypothetical protein PKE04_17350, partial [Clostridia bacterium]|nr:hypothetical protein [Clostridia bacterium]